VEEEEMAWGDSGETDLIWSEAGRDDTVGECCELNCIPAKYLLKS
jgi:hypothetical protein